MRSMYGRLDTENFRGVGCPCFISFLMFALIGEGGGDKVRDIIVFIYRGTTGTLNARTVGNGNLQTNKKERKKRILFNDRLAQSKYQDSLLWKNR